MKSENPVWTMACTESRFYAHHYYAIAADEWEALKEEYDDFPSDFYGYDDNDQKKILGKVKAISTDSLHLLSGLSPGKIIQIKKNGEVQESFAHQPLWKYPIGPAEPCWTIDGGWGIEHIKNTVKYHGYNIAKWNRDDTTTKQVQRFFARNEGSVFVDVVYERPQGTYEYAISYEDLETIDMKKFSFSFVDVPGDYPHFEKFFYDGYFMNRITKVRPVVSVDVKVVTITDVEQ